MMNSFMEEGIDHDDGYRMVEDELLEVAKQFTQHLHAAEYQRMKKYARSQNAATINSISRPVTLKMPDSTLRRVESTSRAKKQANALQSLLRKQRRQEESDESDGEINAYVGTALHSLMDSPRKSVASLVKVAPITATTRAAAGFKRHQPPNVFQQFASKSPHSKYMSRAKFINETHPEHDKNDSTEEEDDLDAPARPLLFPEPTRGKKLPSPNMLNLASKLPPRDLQNSRKHISHLNHPRISSAEVGSSSFPKMVSSTVNGLSTLPSMSVAPSSATKAEVILKPTTTQASSESRLRLAKRLEQSRLRIAKEEYDEKQRKYLDNIPTFI
jgi:hypothetical protein